MPKTNNMALVSLICGVLGWSMLPFVASIVAVVTGHIGRKQIKESYGREEGDGFAIAGLVLGYANLALALIGIVFTVLFFLGILGLGILGAHG